MDSQSSGTRQKKLILVVAGLIYDTQGRILLGQRGPDDSHALCWEFPGGKVESAELPEAALIREFQEELNITPIDPKPWRFVSHSYPRVHLLMPIFVSHSFSGTPKAMDTHDMGWFTRDEITTLKMPQANRPLVDALLREPHPVITC